MAFKLTREVGWLSLRQDVDWTPLLKETPQYKPFVQWDKARADLRRARPPGSGTRSRARWRTAWSPPTPTSRSSTTRPGIAKVMKDMAAQSDELLKKAGVYGTD